MSDQKMSLVIQYLLLRFGRMPTENEVISFIQGDEEARDNIWNKEANK